MIEFAAPKNDERVIHLCKPFVVLSKNTYSAPVTLPLGLAYIGGVLEKAGYKTRILDAIGDTKPVLIKRNVEDIYNVQGLDAQEIIERIEERLTPEFEGRFKIMLVPNITNICYGRGVGYRIEEIVLSKEIQEISATKIRAKMRQEGKLK